MLSIFWHVRHTIELLYEAFIAFPCLCRYSFCVLKELEVNSLNIGNEDGNADDYNDEDNVFPETFLESYSSFRCHEKAIIHSLTSDIK